jgi:hypothetical protein
MKKYSYTLLLLLLSYLTSSAQIALKGQIVDAETGDKIPFASISTRENRSTLSNEMGDFSIPVNELPADLIISHLSYGKSVLKLEENGDHIIRLKATPILLPEVRVGNYARELVSFAAQKLMQNFSLKFYGKAIYRQSTQINQQTSEWQEIIYATKSSNSRLEGTAVLKGRYAAQDAVYKFEDFSYYTKAYGLINLDTNRHAVISLTGSDLYHYSVANLRKEGEREIAEIHFAHKLPAQANSKYGTVFIDTETYDILKITFITHSDLGSKMKNKHPLWVMKMVNPKYEFELSFKDVSGGRSIEYLKVQYRVDYHLKKEILPIYVSSLTYLYETSTQATTMNYEKANAGGNDREVIKKFAYDPEYWKRNTVIERTPEQNRAIQNLEGKGAFGNALGTKRN